eukprot:m.20728 g.20728  ORF g.20728 m.20728 type:complete len:220 (-) comp11048_c0_seq1:63-722(-)
MTTITRYLLYYFSLLFVSHAASTPTPTTLPEPSTATPPTAELPDSTSKTDKTVLTTTRHGKFINDIETPARMSLPLMLAVLFGVAITAFVGVSVLNRRRKARVLYSLSKMEGYDTMASEAGVEAAERHYGELMALPDLDRRTTTQRSNSSTSFTERMKRAWDSLSTRSLSIQSDVTSTNARSSPAGESTNDASDDESICSVCIHDDVDDVMLEATLLKL